MTLTSSTSGSSFTSTASIYSADSTQDGLGQFKLADVPKLRAIFYAEFDNVKGAMIRCQVPTDVVTDDRFSSFSAAVIPKKELLNRLIKVNFPDYKVMGHPIGISQDQSAGVNPGQPLSDKYSRHLFMFNMCFVVGRESTVDCMYEPLVQKCAEYLTELEKECNFLSYRHDTEHMRVVMQRIFDDLNSKGESVFNVGSTRTTVYLKLYPSYRGIEPPKVALYMVPMFTRDLDLVKDPTLIDKMDVLSQKIIPKIDGVRCVKEIASLVEIDADLVSRCIRNLHFYECVSLVPLFLYANTYVATEKLHDFYNNPAEIKDCLEFVRVYTADGEWGPTPRFHDVFRLYLSLRCGKTLAQWCEEIKPRKYNVDERRLVQFGMHHKFIRKLSVYPVSRRPCKPNDESESRIFRLCDGTYALEDLAVEYSIQPDELADTLRENGEFEFISK